MKHLPQSFLLWFLRKVFCKSFKVPCVPCLHLDSQDKITSHIYDLKQFFTLKFCQSNVEHYRLCIIQAEPLRAPQSNP